MFSFWICMVVMHVCSLCNNYLGCTLTSCSFFCLCYISINMLFKERLAQDYPGVKGQAWVCGLPRRDVPLKLTGVGWLSSLRRWGSWWKKQSLCCLPRSLLYVHPCDHENLPFWAPEPGTFFTNKTLFTSNSPSVSSIHLISSLKNIFFLVGVYSAPRTMAR